MICAFASAVAAQQQLGSLELDGPGAGMLGASSFSPTGFEETPDTWTFRQLEPALSLLIAISPVDPEQAVIVGFVEVDGPAWNFIDLGGGVPGVSIAGRDVVFVDVVLALDSAKLHADELILNGTLTRPQDVASAGRSLGALKSSY